MRKFVKRALPVVLFAAFGILAASVPAQAVAPDCAKADTQAAVNMCAAKELGDIHKELNRFRKALSKRINDPDAKAALNEAETAWEAYSDAECKFESSGAAGADAEQTVITYCKVQRAQTRIKVLKRILDCKSDDVTCPPLLMK